MPIKMKKAEPGQGFVKLCEYGDSGSGKTLTGLWFAEHLAKLSNKKVAMIDTERGADFYAIDVPERKIHPKAFEFDREITRSIVDVRDFLQMLTKQGDKCEYGVVFLDSITHLWESARESYTGPLTRAGTYPYQAWGPIKKPFKDMLAAGLAGQYHFIYAGRLGWTFEEDEETGKDRVIGTRVQAERNTGYEPHITLKMAQYWPESSGKPGKEWQIRAYVEKDRSGVLQGKTLVWPKPTDLDPVLKYLSGGQGLVPTFDQAAEHDAARLQQDKDMEVMDQKELYLHIRHAMLDSDTDAALRAAYELMVLKKKKLGDTNYAALLRLKDDRKAEIVTGEPLRALEAVPADIADLQEVES